MRSTPIALVLGLLLLEAPTGAHAVLLCAGKNKATGLVKEGAIIRLRTTCKTSEVALPVSLEDGQQTVRFTGVNVQVVSGSGATAGIPNGRGNLIVGYNEDTAPANDRSGSHNLIVGPEHTYSSYGGIVAGISNTVSGAYASVTGGGDNVASGGKASIAGGAEQTASGVGSFVGGGIDGQATASYSAVLGGSQGIASGFGAVSSGGFGPQATGDYSTAAGGEGARADGADATAIGGSFNVAAGDVATVTGGSHVTESVTYGWSAGSVGALQTGRFASH
jgi:hypothetical protein